MTISDCCGALTEVEYRPDHPWLYDDDYVLAIPFLHCSKCGKVLGLGSSTPPKTPA